MDVSSSSHSPTATAMGISPASVKMAKNAAAAAGMSVAIRAEEAREETRRVRERILARQKNHNRNVQAQQNSI
jgi:hypothetical protein